MQRFTNPRDIYHGKGALEALKGFEGKKAVICVGGGSMKRNCSTNKNREGAGHMERPAPFTLIDTCPEK